MGPAHQHAGADALGQGRMSVLDDAEQSRHGLQIKVRRLSCQELYCQAAHGPNIGGWRDTGHFDHLQAAAGA